MSDDERTIPQAHTPVDPDGTVIMPTPGGRRPVTAAPASSALSTLSAMPAVPSLDPSHYEPDVPAAVGLNPIVAAANPLLNLVARLRVTPTYADPARLLDSLVLRLREFEMRLDANGITKSQVRIARYLLCTFLDEAISGTPWGRSGVLAERSLLATLHGDRYGGEKVFDVLARLGEAPRDNRDLLALHYVCLTLGFEGRFSRTAGGHEQCEAIAARLGSLLRVPSQDDSSALSHLSAQWMPAPIAPPPALTLVPIWVFPALATAIMLGAYLTLNAALNSRTAPALRQLLGAAAQARLDSPVVPGKPRLASALSSDVSTGLLEVRDEPMQSVATLSADRLFGANNARIEAKYLPVLERLAKAVKTGVGELVVIGHTDSVAINSVQFPTNWHLSRARAAAVASVLAANGVAADRLRPEGRADAEPRGGSDSPADGARNRRIEIQWLLPRPDL